MKPIIGKLLATLLCCACALSVAAQVVDVNLPQKWDAKLSDDGKSINLKYSGDLRVKSLKIKQVHPFTVGKDARGKPTKVLFSPGNLQYNPQPPKDINTNWRFARFQWTRCFTGDTYVCVGVEHSKWLDWDDKPKWTDLFGWGMWLESSATRDKINPVKTSNVASDYLPSVRSGIMNVASVMGDDWRLPSSSEFQKLIDRKDKCFLSTIEGVDGMVFLPDDWNTTFDINEWEQMEALGAVFLPAAGCRKEPENEADLYVIPPSLMNEKYPGYWSICIVTYQRRKGWLLLPGDWKSSYEDPRYPDLDYELNGDGWHTATIDGVLWSQLSNLGANFLLLDDIPIDKENTTMFVDMTTVKGCYWTSEAADASKAYNWYFDLENNSRIDTSLRDRGMAVRLVKPLEQTKEIKIPADIAANLPSANCEALQNPQTREWSFAYAVNSSYEVEVEYEDVSAGDPDPAQYTYTGKPIKPVVDVYTDEEPMPDTEYSFSYPDDATNAGGKTLSISILNNAGGKMPTIKRDYEILPKEVIITAANNTKTYGDPDPEFTYTIEGMVENILNPEVLSGLISGKLTREQGEDVGTYDIVQGVLSVSKNYYITYRGNTFTIVPRELQLTWGDTDFVYNGNEQAPTATVNGLQKNDQCNVIVAGAQINAGTYTATASLSNDNYKLPADNTTQFTIDKTDVSDVIPPVPVGGLVFDNHPHTLITTGSASGGTMLYKLADGEYSAQLPQGVSVGFYDVYYYVEGDQNHRSTDAQTVRSMIAHTDLPVVDGDKMECILSSEHFCNGKAKLLFMILAGSADNYSITFDNPEIPAQTGAITANGVLEFSVPITLHLGSYNATIVFSDNEGKESEAYPFVFTVTHIGDLIRKLYDNTLCADNHEHLYSTFKWRHNGSDLDGENHQYLHIPTNLSGYYTAVVTLADNSAREVESCPFYVTTSKQATYSPVAVYPNPAVANSLITIEIMDYDPESEYTILISNNAGKVVKTINNAQQTNQLSLSTGSYSGVLFNQGVKQSFKIIVR